MSRTATTASWTCWTVGRADHEHLREAIQRHRWWSFPRRWGISLAIWVESTTAVKSRKRNKLLWMSCHYSRMCEVRAMSSTEPSTFCSLRCVIFIPEKSLLLITMDWNIIIQRIISYNRCLFFDDCYSFSTCVPSDRGLAGTLLLLGLTIWSCLYDGMDRYKVTMQTKDNG